MCRAPLATAPPGDASRWHPRRARSSPTASGNRPGAASDAAPGLTGRAWRIVLAWVGLVGLLVALGIVVKHSPAVSGFDRRATSWVVSVRSPALDASMKALTWFGSWIALLVTGALLGALAALRKVPLSLAVSALVAWAGESAAVALSKHVVMRPRPPADLWLVRAHGWSWPSGHAAVAVVVFATLATTVSRFVSRRGWRAAVWASAGLWMLAVAFSRIELGVHWTTDVVASLVLVGAWVLVVARVGPIPPDRVTPGRRPPSEDARRHAPT